MTGINPENKSGVPESLLARIWKGQWVQKGALPTSDGRMVRVRSPGIENKDSGPDFLGAIVILDDEILQGDVELHVKSSDWRAHGHHLDRHFNGVILHVVLWDDVKKPAQLENGESAPTLPLHDFLNGSMDELSLRAMTLISPCRGVGRQHGEARIGEILDWCGEERFYLKSAFFEVGLILDEPAEVLYQGVMGALGYTKNKKPFQELARRLPLRVLESIAQEQELGGRSLVLQALLLGGAGLLPSQCREKSRFGDLEAPLKLEDIWRSLNIENAMSYADWHFLRMHPRNFPTRRLLAAGHLFDRYLDQGLLQGVSDLVAGANPGRGARAIESGFLIPDLIGRGRAREITVNVVLPFSLALAESDSHPKIGEHILGLYRTYPRPGGNQITRYLSELFWGAGKPEMVNSARRQQGLIHLYQTFCREQRCEVCPVNVEIINSACA
ncbi:MAG TPA: hypothetical protein DCY61_04525 [Dehalococcoidia bacterium]|nr:hypothetical protein [Dehalococcoidia bacterium]